MSQHKPLQVSRPELIKKYGSVRAFTEYLCEPLELEDYVIQSMHDVSPLRWHLAHTAWFFETFLLKPHLAGYQTPNELYDFLFNSYYNAVGTQYPRPKRGLLSRPTVAQIFDYRQHVDLEMLSLLEKLDDDKLEELSPFIELGLQHEQQHQELMLTDLKHIFFQNPLYPAYTPALDNLNNQGIDPQAWQSFPGGQIKVGYDGSGFAYDNESPSHEVLQQDFEISNRLVTNAEYLAFIDDGAYGQAHYWLSDGWTLINGKNWQSPLYWIKQDQHWFEFTLSGLQTLDINAPVSHLSYYEADAFANWAGARLPGEFEWEQAVQHLKIEGNFVESGSYQPHASTPSTPGQLHQFYGDVWEWTRSPYTPYPGFKAASGAIGEYNGKFMSNQMVLKGGSCVSSRNHLRATYRNFFYPHSRWQFTGLRLARDIDS
ncbi:ergothioneine biosynthesis protein EgtB [bacterium]|nr:ergothioneine biosynthesis protein EgtB [bacterium]